MNTIRELERLSRRMTRESLMWSKAAAQAEMGEERTFACWSGGFQMAANMVRRRITTIKKTRIKNPMNIKQFMDLPLFVFASWNTPGTRLLRCGHRRRTMNMINTGHGIHECKTCGATWLDEGGRSA